MFWEDECSIQAQDAAAFYGYFSELFLQAIPVPGSDYVSALRDATTALFDLGPTTEGTLMESFFAAVDHDPETTQRDLAVDRTMLCRAVKPGLLLAPYEGNYRKSDDKEGVSISHAEKAYRSAGVAFQTAERADYLGVELAFAALLAQREAEAAKATEAATADGTDASNLTRGENAPQPADWRDIRKAFVRDHLAWVPLYCKTALPHASTDFWRGALSILASTLSC